MDVERQIMIAVAWADIYALTAIQIIKRLAWLLLALVVVLIVRRRGK